MGARMNWAAATDRARMRKHGAETINGQAMGSKPASKAQPVQRARKRKGPTLDEPIIVDKWWKNRSGQAVFVRLSTFEQSNILDIRTWYTDAEGISRPGKGFACTVKHLPRLVDALTKACARARELGLIDEAGE